MGVVTGEGGQEGIIGTEGRGKGSAKREEQNEEWMQQRLKNLLGSVTALSISVRNASYPDPDNCKGF